MGSQALASGAGRTGRERTRDLPVLIGVIGAEAALLLTGVAWGSPPMTAWIALGAVYLLLAFRVPDLAWMLALVAVAVSWERILPGGAAIAVPSEPMIALALAGWSLRRLYGAGPPLSGEGLQLPLAVCAAVALLSVVLGLFPVVGIKAWIVAAGYAAFGYVYFGSTRWSAGRIERWLRLFALLVAGLGLYGVWRVAALGVGPRAAYGAARPFFMDHGTYAAFLGFFIPFALFEALERHGRARAAYAAAFAAGIAGVAFSFTRAAWIATALALPVALFGWAALRRSVRSLVLPIAVAFAIVGAVALQGTFDRFTRHAGSVAEVENVSNLERVNRWMAALQMARDRPAFGVGYGGYADAYSVYRRKAIVTEEVYGHFGAHSEPLRLLAESGVPGLLAGLWFVAAVLGAGWLAFRRAPATPRGRIALAATVGIATYAIHGVFNSYLGQDKVSAPFWLLVGLIAAMSRESEGPRPRPDRT